MSLLDWFILPDSEIREMDRRRYLARLNERVGAETIAERACEPYNPERFVGDFDDFHRAALERNRERGNERLRSVPAKKALPG